MTESFPLPTRRVVLHGCLDGGRDKELVLKDLSRPLLLEVFERQWPELWTKCYPRIYEGGILKHFSSPKCPAFDMATAVLKNYLLSKENADIARSGQYEYCFASRLAMFQVPTYFVAPEMALAIRHTKPPMEFAWHDMELPWEAALFMLPKGTLVHPQYGEMPYVGYSRCKQNEIYPSPLDGGHPFGITNGGLTMCTGSIEPARMLHFNWAHTPVPGGGDCSPVIRLRDLDADMANHRDDTSSYFFPLGMEPEDNRIMREAAHYLFGCLVMLLNRPDFMTRGALRKRVKSDGEARPREFWSPHILGEHFKLRRGPSKRDSGSHASPRYHWVSGSWRNVNHGENWSLTRKQWVAPYDRGGDS
jgi:hypothetical protein